MWFSLFAKSIFKNLYSFCLRFLKSNLELFWRFWKILKSKMAEPRWLIFLNVWHNFGVIWRHNCHVTVTKINIFWMLYTPHKFHFHRVNYFWDTGRFTQIWCLFNWIFSFHEIFPFYEEFLPKSLQFLHPFIFSIIANQIWSFQVTFLKNLEIQDGGFFNARRHFGVIWRNNWHATVTKINIFGCYW